MSKKLFLVINRSLESPNGTDSSSCPKNEKKAFAYLVRSENCPTEAVVVPTASENSPGQDLPVANATQKRTCLEFAVLKANERSLALAGATKKRTCRELAVPTAYEKSPGQNLVVTAATKKRTCRELAVIKAKEKHSGPECVLNPTKETCDEEQPSSSGNATNNKLRSILKKTPEPPENERNFICPECLALFKTKFSYKRHVRRKHPDKLHILKDFNKSYKFKCSVCDKRFNSVHNLNHHEKKMHGKLRENARNRCHKCPLCTGNFDRLQIHKHLEGDHDVTMQKRLLMFNNFENFSEWKVEIERDTNSLFIKESSLERLGHFYHYFICHRSGKFVSKGKGQRRLKSQGSKKINAFCPASMKVSHSKGKEVRVFFQSVHLGHGDEISHLWLTPDDKKYLAEKLAANLSLDEILEEVRSNIADDERSRRLHFLTRKDLHNIKKSVSLGSGGTIRHQDEGPGPSALEKQTGNSKIDIPSHTNECLESSEVDNVQDETVVNTASSITVEEKNRLKEMFANFVDSATLEEFKLLEFTCGALDSQLKAIREHSQQMLLLQAAETSSSVKSKGSDSTQSIVSPKRSRRPRQGKSVLK